MAAKQGDAALLEPGQLRRVVEVVDDLVAPREHRADVELAGRSLGGPRHAARLGERLRRAQQPLRGHAGVERAFPADQLLLDQRDRQALLGQAPGAHLPAGPAPSTTTSKSRMSLTSPTAAPPSSCSTEELRATPIQHAADATRTSYPHRLEETLAGQLLLASPALRDPNFERTVVLIGVHSDEGAMGVVLNRPSAVTVGEAAPQLEQAVSESDPVFVGGPVQPTSVVFLAEFLDPSAGRAAGARADRLCRARVSQALWVPALGGFVLAG